MSHTMASITCHLKAWAIARHRTKVRSLMYRLPTLLVLLLELTPGGSMYCCAVKEPGHVHGR